MLAIESACIYPHYLAFFNFAVAVRPRDRATCWIPISDWGQDLLKLRDCWIARGRPRLRFHYFGTAGMDYYGVPHDEVPRIWQAEERGSMD